MTHLAASLTPPAPRPLLTEEAGEDAAAALRGATVLLVEDEVFIAAELRDAMEGAGAAVRYARTLKKALALLESERFDGAVLDVTLGQHCTCEPVAAKLAAGAVPFVLHSGDLTRQGEVIETIDAPLIPKPAEAEAVVAGLARAIQTARQG